MSWSVIDSFILTACQCPLTGLSLLLPSRPLILDFSLATRPSFTTTSPYYRLLAYNTPRAGSFPLGHQRVGDGLTGWPRTTLSTPFLPALRSLDIPFTLGNRSFAVFFSLSFLAILLFPNDEVLQSLTTFDIYGPLVPPFNQPSTLSFTPATSPTQQGSQCYLSPLSVKTSSHLKLTITPSYIDRARDFRSITSGPE